MTSIKVGKYNLLDSYLYENNIDTPLIKVWIPEKICIVLGRSNNSTDSLYRKNILDDNIPVYKRPSGGETVLLTPKTLIISIAMNQSGFMGGKVYFKMINNKIIDSLKSLGIKNLNYRGISDIAINDVKILGSALYQNIDVVFYHAVLNVSESIELIEKYIKHPNREPDYRKNRSHKDFVTSLAKENYSIDIDKIKNALENGFPNLHL
jgi:lipoate-protein ligase A